MTVRDMSEQRYAFILSLLEKTPYLTIRQIFERLPTEQKDISVYSIGAYLAKKIKAGHLKSEKPKGKIRVYFLNHQKPPDAKQCPGIDKSFTYGAYSRSRKFKSYYFDTWGF